MPFDNMNVQFTLSLHHGLNTVSINTATETKCCMCHSLSDLAIISSKCRADNLNTDTYLDSICFLGFDTDTVHVHSRERKIMSQLPHGFRHFKISQTAEYLCFLSNYCRMNESQLTVHNKFYNCICAQTISRCNIKDKYHHTQSITKIALLNGLVLVYLLSVIISLTH